MAARKITVDNITAAEAAVKATTAKKDTGTGPVVVGTVSSKTVPETITRAQELFAELQERAENYKSVLAAEDEARKVLESAKDDTWAAHQDYRRARTALEEELLGSTEVTPPDYRISYRR